MPKIVFSHVPYVISVSLTVRGMDAVSGTLVGPTRQWERGKIPSFLSSTASTPTASLAAPPTAAILGSEGAPHRLPETLQAEAWPATPQRSADPGTPRSRAAGSSRRLTRVRACPYLKWYRHRAAAD
jgi:hypothetical protein